MKKQYDTDEMMRSLNSSLARQVQEELDRSSSTRTQNGRAAQSSGSTRRSKKKKKKKRILLKTILTLILMVTACLAFLILTKPGRSVLIHFATEYAYSRLDYAGTEDVDSTLEDGSDATDGTGSTGGSSQSGVQMDNLSQTFQGARQEEGVVNILLLGVEAIGYGQSGGHTDVIMIATMNTNTGELKLTSLLRDTWVTIPGFNDNRINAAYSKGGMETLYETIATNYDLKLDGYALVGFTAFEQIIDTLGGVEIELTAEEAEYLNTTNYISNKAYRNVVPGKQVLNGNQALGYCRVRKVATLDGSNYDMGRTSRHRRVMSAVFAKLKTSGITDLVNVMNQVLPLVETDVSKENCKDYLGDALEIGLKNLELQTLRLPEDGHYDTPRIDGKAVLVPHWEDTISTLHEFIFEAAPEEAAGE